MCGIAGRIADGHPGTGAAAVRAMCEAIAHRGPDGQGLWNDPGADVSLAHRRLSIIDLSEGGAQPMHSRDGRYVVVFNGEIYNYRDLRAGLDRDGVVLRSTSDTEVLIELWARHGTACIPMLRGMFAFAMWDMAARVGWLVRDGLGIKPMYYALSGNALLFASELRAVLASGEVERRVDPDALAEYFETGSVPEPMTLVRDVHVLPAGHLLRWERGEVTIQRHWSLPFGAHAPVEGEGGEVALLRSALEESVAAHFVSDVPVAMFLSGGIDSTALLALSAHAGLADALQTFTVGVDDPAFDESTEAAATARHFGVRHERLQLDVSGASRLLPDYLDAIDSPSIDGFNTWIVSGLAHGAGAKVALSGLGGDELFGGYPSFNAVPKLARLAHAAARLPGGVMAATGALGVLARIRPEKAGQARRMAGAIGRGGGLRAVHRAYRGLFPPDDARRLAAHFAGEPGPSSVLHTLRGDLSPREQVGVLEVEGYMRNQLLRDSDVMSMAHGLEIRLPLVDTRLYEQAARITPGRRLRAGKQMLLDAVPEVPSQVWSRPKRGFRFPFERWVGQGLAGRLPANIPVPLPAWYHQWAVLVIVAWMQQHDLRA